MKKTIIPLFLIASIILNIYTVSGQENNKNDSSMVTYYLHVTTDSLWWNEVLRGNQLNKDSVVGFELVIASFDSSNNFYFSWKSKKISPLEKDKSGYFMKVDIPNYIAYKYSRLWCEALFVQRSQNGVDTVERLYGGTNLSKIKLVLKTTPEGAETFLIPNRIWLERFENSSTWQNNDTALEDYQVNTSNTNTYAYIDETVYVVIFKMNNQYKKVTYHTKPVRVEQEQIVWTQFK